jgi:hypothetical protein
MGREARVRVTLGGESAEAHALLEGTELILRGAWRRRWPLDALAAVRVEHDALVFEADGGTVRLALGATQAAAWARKIALPPPTLASKMGLGPAAPAWVCGPLDDTQLAQALRDATTTNPHRATQLVAVVLDDAGLASAMAQFGRLPAARHAWLVYPKGRAAAPGDSAIRAAMRAAGFADSKSCAVSERLTATRYSKR